MTAVPGGAADKAGNRYEDLWTAMRVADLIRGRASSMQLEPIGSEGIGIEFQIELSDGAWGEQTKHTADNWTIKRLQGQGVLAAAKQQIEQGRSYRLVTSSPASSLETLANRARSTASLSEFKSSLSKRLLADFDEVSRHWGDVDHEVSRARLTRIEVEQHPLASLLRGVRQGYEGLYAGDPGLVIAAVTAYCRDVVHQTVTAPMVAGHLRSLRPPEVGPV